MLNQLSKWDKTLTELEINYKTAVKQSKAEKEGLASAKADIKAITEAQSILQQVAKTIEEQAHKQIAGIVSKCLTAVFDEPYEFVVDFTTSRGKTSARLLFRRNGQDVEPDSIGGGVVDVASFALRLSCLMLRRPPSRRLLVLDEPFKGVWAGYHERIRQLLTTLATELKVQIIMVTQIEGLQTGKVIEI